MTDWVTWHEAYADAESSLARRLRVVRRRIGEALDAAGEGPSEGPIRILSLCAGAGRDVLPELAARPGLAVSAVLVELDERLAAEAREGAAGIDGVEVRRADAGDPATFAVVLPVELLLLCGIFGNVAPEDIRRTVHAVPGMLVPGGTVIWTRGTFEGVEDLRPAVRRWFVEAGLEEISFDGAPERFGVGVARWPGTEHQAPRPTEHLTGRLFTFVK